VIVLKQVLAASIWKRLQDDKKEKDKDKKEKDKGE